MIEISSTKRRTGLSVTGDPLDLDKLKDFIYKFSKEGDDFSYAVAHDARKASYGDRLKHSVMCYTDNSEREYYSFNVTLPDWLYFIDELLINVARIPADEYDHSVVLLLKYYTKKILCEEEMYQGTIMFECLGHLEISPILKDIAIKEFLSSRAGKKRLEDLFSNLRQFSKFSFSEYKKELIDHYTIEAQKLNCHLEDLRLGDSLDDLYEKIKW